MKEKARDSQSCFSTVAVTTALAPLERALSAMRLIQLIYLAPARLKIRRGPESRLDRGAPPGGEERGDGKWCHSAVGPTKPVLI